MKLKKKILLLVLFPSIILSIVVCVMVHVNIKSSIYEESFKGMHASTLAIKSIFETGNIGDYHLDNNNELWKGDSLNISKATDIVDSIKETTGKEVTIFYKDTRYLTSIVNEQGVRQIGTQSSPLITKTVLDQGKNYQSDNVDILGTKYIVYYLPLYQESTNTPVGMIFLGTLQSEVDILVSKTVIKLIIAIASLLLITAISVSIIVGYIVKPLTTSISAVHTLSSGDLRLSINGKYYDRKDEIGTLCRSVRDLDQKLISIIGGIQKSSDTLVASSNNLDLFSREAFHSIEQVDFVVQEIASSSSAQAHSTDEASKEVHDMGALVDETTQVINDLNVTIDTIMTTSKDAEETLSELHNSMNSVMDVIDNVNKQTNLTNESVTKISETAMVITAIANQTNLLALNASIEAARAGQEGKGFAVVASEIKNLAAQSNLAALEIQSLLEQLTKNSNQAVHLMLDARETIAVQKDNLVKTVHAFQVVESGIHESVTGIDAISLKTDTLDISRKNTIKAVESLTAIAEENAAGTEEVAASVEEIRHQIQDVAQYSGNLSGIAKELKVNLDIFQL